MNIITQRTYIIPIKKEYKDIVIQTLKNTSCNPISVNVEYYMEEDCNENCIALIGDINIENTIRRIVFETNDTNLSKYYVVYWDKHVDVIYVNERGHVTLPAGKWVTKINPEKWGWGIVKIDSQYFGIEK